MKFIGIPCLWLIRQKSMMTWNHKRSIYLKRDTLFTLRLSGDSIWGNVYNKKINRHQIRYYLSGSKLLKNIIYYLMGEKNPHVPLPPSSSFATDTLIGSDATPAVVVWVTGGRRWNRVLSASTSSSCLTSRFQVSRSTASVSHSQRSDRSDSTLDVSASGSYTVN